MIRQAIRVDELDSADTSDSLDEMKIRVQYKHLRYPYLYDGETQSCSARAWVRRPRRMSSCSIRTASCATRAASTIAIAWSWSKREDARNAVDALLAGKPVPVAANRRFWLLHQVERKAWRLA